MSGMATMCSEFQLQTMVVTVKQDPITLCED